MKKLKLKKRVKKLALLAIIVLIFLTIGIYSTISIYKQKQYEKTYEYKLITKGYEKDKAKLIIKNFKDKEIDYILQNEVNDLYLSLFNTDYFIYNNFYEYLNYYINNNNFLLREIVEIVNTHRDIEYYKEEIQTQINLEEKLLVNKYYYVDKDYVPKDLVTISQKYSWGKAGTHKTTKITYDAFKEMWKAANDEGYYLMINSSYRTYEDQEKVHKDYATKKGSEYADTIAARPGHSEHQTGYALDIFEKNNSSTKTFHESDAYLWLKDNSYKYGFILRYEEDDEDITGYDFESWHYRYVGEDIATYIYKNNITFDEYYEYYLN